MALTDNLVSYWKLDESSGNASDSVGSNTLTNTNVTYAAVKINNGAVLNGSNAQLSGSFTGASVFTVSCWANLTTLEHAKYIWARRNTTNNANYGLSSIWSTPDTHYHIVASSWDGSGGGADGSISPATELSKDTIYHFVYVVNGASSVLYINGSATNGSVNTNTSGADFFVGSNSSASYQTGKVDEIGYWTRALSSTEVTTLYNSGNGISYSFATPTVTTSAVSSITSTTATGNGNVTADGGNNITERGTVYSTSANPTTSDTKDTAAGTTGAFTTSIDSLTPGTLYHVRAYAINSIGTSYGADVEFTTLSVAPTVTTQAVSSIASTTATGNGNITATGGTNAYQRGVATVPGASGDITFAVLTDPSFESGQGNWTGVGSGTFASSSDQAKYGTKSGKLTYVSGGEAYTDYGPTESIYQSKTVTFGCWVYSATAGIARLSVYDNNGGGYEVSYSSFHTGNSTWQWLTVTRTFRASLTDVIFRLHWAGTSAGSAYFDGPIIAISPNTTAPTITFDSGDYGTGAFTTSLTSLTANTDYRATAYATNPVGTGYGSTVAFTTLASGPANLKSYNTNLVANIKSINTNLIANVKSLNTNV